jgi:hypothetical protein
MVTIVPKQSLAYMNAGHFLQHIPIPARKCSSSHTVGQFDVHMCDASPSCVTGMQPVPTNFVYGSRLLHSPLNRKHPVHVGYPMLGCTEPSAISLCGVM